MDFSEAISKNPNNRLDYSFEKYQKDCRREVDSYLKRLHAKLELEKRKDSADKLFGRMDCIIGGSLLSKFRRVK